MRFDDLYVAGAASWLPSAVTVDEAIADGSCDPAAARRCGAKAVTVAGAGECATGMAARAARVALERAAVAAGDVGLLLHATLYDQGHDLWGAASHVQALALAGEHPACPALEVRQVSNGGMGAVELAAAFLRAGTGRPAALLTAGDVFCPPGFDRWRSDPGTVYADGGAALVLSRAGGFARLRSLVTVSEPRLEGMHRGDHPFAPAVDGRVRRVDLDECKRQFLARAGRAAAIARVSGGQRRALNGALEQAGLTVAGIDAFVLPHLGRRRLEAGFFQPFGIAPERSTCDWGRGVGHLGGGDQFAGLAHLVESKRVSSGDRVLLAGIGAGFTWSAAVLEIVEVPSWPEQASR
ncbi:ketoacyl-ACP synthase III family protein [Streptantibioticus silvisoli]|uniref:Ketoacyl-ACP synthase III family protein n=1 Tax=Streptantibioticus silvisoli TaxID=2705255 RepID=A0ABT6W7G4_9ACTN|nr:ketoacyl-ACP synthase III family protein [Streptantibioticus silvisoli]MDI5965421.1 ketoacyl-ACP synthase III family protein [Streptantibioticus silvisoli]